MSEQLQNLLSVVGQNRLWAPAFVFMVAFLGSLPFVGLFIPTTSILLGLGAVVAFSGGALGSLILAAGAGVVLGAWISYEIGRRYGQVLLTHPFFIERPGLIGSARTLFNRQAAASVAIARFLPVLRPMVPMVAGALGLDRRGFHTVNLLSACIWAPTFILPGALAGAAATLLEGRAMLSLALLLGAMVLGAWGLVELRRVPAPLAKALTSLRARVLINTRAGPRWLRDLAKISSGRGHRRLRRYILGSVVAGLIAIYGQNLIIDVARLGPVIRADSAILNLTSQVSWQPAQMLMAAVAGLSDWPIQLVVAGLLALRLAWRGNLRWAGAVATALALTGLCVFLLNLTVTPARQGPPNAAFDYAFVNGQTASVLALTLVLAAISARALSQRWRWAPWTAAAAFSALVGASQIYLRSAWPSDVLIGLSVGGAIGAGIILTVSALQPAQPHSRAASNSGAIALVTALAWVWLGPSAIRTAEASVDALPALVTAQGATPSLPIRRVDLWGQYEEPFTGYWTGYPVELAALLRAAGWSAVPELTPGGALLFLDPQTDVRQLPAPAVLHDGRFATLTFSAPDADPNQRRVLRVWPLRGAAHGRAGVYAASITTEVARRPAQLFTMIDERDDEVSHNPYVGMLPFTPVMPTS